MELDDGSTIRGHLNENGQAEIRGMRSRPGRVRYGLEPFPYEIAGDGGNPAFLSHFSKTDADRLVETRISAAGQEPVPGAKSMALEAMDWIWGTLKGGFNEKQVVSQILVDACIGMIPLVGDVTAVRDLLALMLGMAEDPKKRESKMEWALLAVLLFALVPVLGGAVKGIGKLLFKGGKDLTYTSAHLAEIVSFLNRIGIRDALAWLRNLDLEGYTNTLLSHWREWNHRIQMVLEAVPRRFQRLLPESKLEYLAKRKTQLQALSQRGEAMIPEAVRDVNERLKRVREHVYQGNWHAIPKSLTSKTWETEARLVDVPGGMRWVVEKMPHPPNGPEAFVHKENWPDLTDKKNPKYVEINLDEILTHKVIPCFSGPMRPVKIPPGTRICRIIEDKKFSAGDWWVYALPESGQNWREGLAVLDSWNGNGLYVEMVVPETGLFAWEGKAASQVENGEKAVETAGQYLQGGQIQLFIDFEHPPNLPARTYILEEPLETHWSGHTKLHVPPKEVQVEYLQAYEFARKARISATTWEKAGSVVGNEHED